MHTNQLDSFKKVLKVDFYCRFKASKFKKDKFLIQGTSIAPISFIKWIAIIDFNIYIYITYIINLI